jgi:hypothetical protein
MYKMPKPVKQTTKSEVETTSPATIVPVIVEPVVKEKKAKKTKPVVEESVSAVVKVEEPVVVSTETPALVVPAVEDHVDSAVAEKSDEFLSKLQQLGGLLASLKVEYKALEKQWSRELKLAQKQSSKRKRKAGNRAPSGFVKPAPISNELAKFLGKPEGSELARTEVTREINNYIKAHDLQDKGNGRQINADTKLAALLKLEKSNVLTYFNLQRYMSCHFVKAPAKVVA